MKRMSIKHSPKSNVSYKLVNSDDHLTVSNSLKKKWLPCGTLSKKTYIFLILLGIVLVWIFIYYKLLNHRFELPEPLRKLRKMFGDGQVKNRHGREEETENIIISTEKGCSSQFRKERNAEIIYFAIVACDSRYEDALVNMKSITLVTNYNLHFHIFTDDKHIKKETFDKKMKKWPAWTEHWMMFTVHPIRYTVGDSRVDWVNLFKLCASQRLFLASILVDVDALIYVDTDTLFLQAPEHLWNNFKHFNETQIAGLVFECETMETCWYRKSLQHPFFEPYGLNSGVMLMNLTRMRKLNWENLLLDIYLKYKQQIAYGDQDIINIYFQSFREKLYRILCPWNYRPDHCMLGNNCEKANTSGISLLHGSRNVFKKHKLQSEFYIVYEAFRNYQFKDNFQKTVVNPIRDMLSSDKYNTLPCGRMMDALLKHLIC